MELSTCWTFKTTNVPTAGMPVNVSVNICVAESNIILRTPFKLPDVGLVNWYWETVVTTLGTKSLSYPSVMPPYPNTLPFNNSWQLAFKGTVSKSNILSLMSKFGYVLSLSKICYNN